MNTHAKALLFILIASHSSNAAPVVCDSRQTFVGHSAQVISEAKTVTLDLSRVPAVFTTCLKDSPAAPQCEESAIDLVETKTLPPINDAPQFSHKYYSHKTQADFQLFADMSFIANNGSGYIIIGSCGGNASALNVQVTLPIDSNATVWIGDEIIATGTGVAPGAGSIAERRGTAQKRAKSSALRELVAVLSQIRLSNGSKIPENAMLALASAIKTQDVIYNNHDYSVEVMLLLSIDDIDRLSAPQWLPRLFTTASDSQHSGFLGNVSEAGGCSIGKPCGRSCINSGYACQLTVNSNQIHRKSCASGCRCGSSCISCSKRCTLQ